MEGGRRGRRRPILDAVVPNGGFTVADDGIYFVTGPAPFTLRFLVSHRTTAVLANVEDPIVYLSVSPDRKSMLYSRNEQVGSDLMVVEHFQ